jgi:hypothetical protein
MTIPTSVYSGHLKVNHASVLTLGARVFELCSSFASKYEKLEKPSFWPFWDHLRILLARHSFPNSEMLDLLCRVIFVNVENHLLLQLSPSSGWQRLTAEYAKRFAIETSKWAPSAPNR